jgi:8-oxo-dGTP pyrophosphatase MutT (NUDIX family)
MLWSIFTRPVVGKGLSDEINHLQHSSCSRNISRQTKAWIILSNKNSHKWMKRAYGGVLINDSGRVLLRKPRGLHKTRVWTFAKGKPLDGETGEQTAIREVLEETGVRAKIIRALTPSTELGIQDEYFLMVPLQETGQFDDETTAIVWATKAEAEELISMTQDRDRRLRDLNILQCAFEIFSSVNGMPRSCLSEKGDLS